MPAHRFLFLLLSLMIAAGCSRSGLVLEESADSATDLVVAGDVRLIMEGKATSENFWSIAPGIYGVAVGTLADRADPTRQGTGMVVGGVGFLRPVAGPSAKDSSLLVSDSVYSSFLAGIPPKAVPAARYRVSGGFRGVPLERVLSELRRQHDGRLFLVGLADFHVLLGTSLTASPGGGESLAGRNRVSAFRRADQLEKVPVLFAGVMVADDKELTDAERHVFFVDTRDPRTEEPAPRIHGVVLGSGEVADWRQPATLRRNAVLATEVLPLSVLDSGTLEVFVLDNFDVRP